MNSINTRNRLQEFNRNIQNLIHENTITLNCQNKYQHKKWWNTDIQKLYKLRNNAIARYQTYRTIENLNKLAEAQKNLQDQISTSKKENFKILLDEISNTTDTKVMWRKINNLKKYGSPKRSHSTWTKEQSSDFLK